MWIVFLRSSSKAGQSNLGKARLQNGTTRGQKQRVSKSSKLQGSQATKVPSFTAATAVVSQEKDHVCTRLRTSDNTCKPYKGQNTNGQVQLRTKYISDKVSNQPGGFAYILEMSGINDIYK